MNIHLLFRIVAAVLFVFAPIAAKSVAAVSPARVGAFAAATDVPTAPSDSAASRTALPHAASMPAPRLRLSGTLRTDVLVPRYDARIGTDRVTDRVLGNSYLDLRLTAGRNFEAGARAEYMRQPLPGFEPDFRGAGLPFVYATGRLGGAALTLGSFYEQFGAGLVLRTYEEPSLGIDNHLRGARLRWEVGNLHFKALAGRQRRYWETNPSYIYGADAEWDIAGLLPKLRARGSTLTLGASWVLRDERPDAVDRIDTAGFSNTFTLRRFTLAQPRRVSAVDLRAKFSHGGFDLLAEYAAKGQDPSFDNGYTYGRGSALLLSAGWSKRGRSVLIQAKRAENMSFRSRRADVLTASALNHLPPFAAQPTYALTALYPYATANVPGEWAFRGEASLTLPRRTLLGGRYGTTLRLRAAQIFDLALRRDPAAAAAGGDGERPLNWWAMGGTRYREVGLDVERRLSRPVRLHALLLAQTYDKTAVEGHGGTVRALVGALESRWQISHKVALRGEAQYLRTREDRGDWWAGLVEVSLLPHLLFTLSDQYNGRVSSTEGAGTSAVHYVQAFATYTDSRHRLQLGYGATRAGYNCAGGVCRYVPAQKGFTLSYQLRF